MDINCDMIKNVLMLFKFVLSSFFLSSSPEENLF